MLLNSIASLNSSVISFAAQIPAWGMIFRFWKDLFRWSGILVPSCLINILQSTTLLMSQFGELMFFGWVFVNTESEKNPLCILSCSDPLILPSIDIFLLIVSQYISWSGYWCSCCSVSLWCLLNVSICTPISCFFIHLHLLLSRGHHFVPIHPYLQCFTGKERDMTLVFILFSTSVVIVLGLLGCFCIVFITDFWDCTTLKKIQFVSDVLFTRMQAASIPSWEDLGIFDSRRVVAVEAKVPVCLFSWVFVLLVSEKSDSFASFLS